MGLVLAAADKCSSGLHSRPHYSCHHEQHRAEMMVMMVVMVMVMVTGWFWVAPHRCWQWPPQAFD